MRNNRAALPIRAITPLRVCSWNLENFDAQNEEKLNRMADAITGPLQCPHILAVQEMFGGFATEANPTPHNPNAEALIDAIARRSGRHYRYAEISPKEQANRMPEQIRCGFFYRTDRVRLAAPQEKTMPHDTNVFVAKGKDIRILHQNPQTLAQPGSPLTAARAILGQFEDIQSGEQYFIANAHLKSNPGLYHRPENTVSPEESKASLWLQLAQARYLRECIKDLWGAHSPYASELDSHVILCGDFNAPTPQPGTSNATLDVLQDTHLVCMTSDLPAGSSHRVGQHSSDIDHAYVSWPLAGYTHTSRPILNGGENRLSDHNPTIMEIAPPLRVRPTHYVEPRVSAER